MTEKGRNKTQLVLDYLRSGKKLTSLDAINMFGVTRLAATIFLLKERGHVITSEIVKRPDRYGNICDVAEYKLHEKEQGDLF